jgi:hypothetical protein
MHLTTLENVQLQFKAVYVVITNIFNTLTRQAGIHEMHATMRSLREHLRR